MFNKSTFLDSIWHKNIGHTPIWLMRQAGRYLPEYREVRNKAGSFLKLCKNPDLATEVTMQPLHRFDLDAAILFSDILVVPEAMGMKLDFIENEGPKFDTQISTTKDIDNLNIEEINHKLEYVFQTIKNLKATLPSNIPLIGFSGSPFTLLCYMLEGGASKNYLTVKHWLYTKPELTHKLLTKITIAVVDYLNGQIKSGVNAIMLFDSWGGILTDDLYTKFSLNYMNDIISRLQLEYNGHVIPSIIFTKGGGIWLDKIDTIGADVIGLDWTINIKDARKIIRSTALQGNLDPVLLASGNINAIKNEAKRILDNYRQINNSISGHIFNLGHGILPMTNPDHVKFLIDFVHEYSSN